MGYLQIAHSSMRAYICSYTWMSSSKFKLNLYTCKVLLGTSTALNPIHKTGVLTGQIYSELLAQLDYIQSVKIYRKH